VQFGPDSPALNQFWFGPLSEDLLLRLRMAQRVRISIPQQNGLMTYELTEGSLALVQEVIAGVPA